LAGVGAGGVTAGFCKSAIDLLLSSASAFMSLTVFSSDAMRSFAEAHHLKVIASTYDADYFLVSVGTGVQ